ncbi:hypothetical protein B0T21DRAFT_347086 [Apiosordaria backusii]|uniref:Uncharacterized protein n=1 Tax=Apiosordaria backusii TaxID=314023 RepID=A0AA40EH17_9PEZI|nr:hypothetical protein B0T21DRAFT_347086 [Apiosordaria backusii]
MPRQSLRWLELRLQKQEGQRGAEAASQRLGGYSGVERLKVVGRQQQLHPEEIDDPEGYEEELEKDAGDLGFGSSGADSGYEQPVMARMATTRAAARAAAAASSGAANTGTANTRTANTRTTNTNIANTRTANLGATTTTTTTTRQPDPTGRIPSPSSDEFDNSEDVIILNPYPSSSSSSSSSSSLSSSSSSSARTPDRPPSPDTPPRGPDSPAVLISRGKNTHGKDRYHTSPGNSKPSSGADLYWTGYIAYTNKQTLSSSSPEGLAPPGGVLLSDASTSSCSGDSDADSDDSVRRQRRKARDGVRRAVKEAGLSGEFDKDGKVMNDKEGRETKRKKMGLKEVFNDKKGFYEAVERLGYLGVLGQSEVEAVVRGWVGGLGNFQGGNRGGEKGKGVSRLFSDEKFLGIWGGRVRGAIGGGGGWGGFRGGW